MAGCNWESKPAGKLWIDLMHAPANDAHAREALMAECEPLRTRLLALRRSTLSRLAAAGRIDAEMLELIAHTGDALAAIEAETMQAVAPIPGDRALIVDDNVTVQIVVYSADRQAAAATLSPVAAIRTRRATYFFSVPPFMRPALSEMRVCRLW